MFKQLSKAVFSIVLFLTLLQPLYPDGVADRKTASPAAENKDNHKVKSFINFVKTIFSRYKENPKEVEGQLGAASSGCSIFIINSCKKPQFLELTKFRLKNKELFSKLGYIFLNALTEINCVKMQSLNLSDEEMDDIKNIAEEILKIIPKDIKETDESVIKIDLGKDAKINEIMQKLDTPLDNILKYHVGLTNDISDAVKEKFKQDLGYHLGEVELKELHTFITKEKGAYDKMAEEISQIWEIATNCLR